MWMLIISALLLGCIIGMIIGGLATGSRIMDNIEKKGLVEWKGAIYLMKKVEVSEIDEIRRKHQGEGG